MRIAWVSFIFVDVASFLFMDKFLFVDLKVDTCLFIKGLGHPFAGHFGRPKYGIYVLPYVLKGLEFPIRFGIILHEKVQDVINVDPRIFQIKFVVLEVDFCPEESSQYLSLSMA
jgi:hypothetical protein